MLCGGVYDNLIDLGRRVYDENGIAPTQHTVPGANMETKIKTGVRIRKLTPRECWRMMGFYDDDFDRAKEVNSDSQLYKQAGNSIVVDVLMAIFGRMV